MPDRPPAAPVTQTRDDDLAAWAAEPPEVRAARPAGGGSAGDGSAADPAPPSRPVDAEAAALDEGTRDGRYEPVGVNRRLVIGTALGFVALVLLGLMAVTGGDDGAAVFDAESPREAPPEFIEREPVMEPPPAFADPEPYAYSAPPDPYAPDAYAPPPYSPSGAYGTYGVPNNAPPAPPAPPRAAGPTEPSPADLRVERYDRARTSPLLVDASSGALSVAGRRERSAPTGRSVPPSPSADRDELAALTPEQRASYGELDPEWQAAIREALRLAGVVGPTAPPPAAPPAALSTPTVPTPAEPPGPSPARPSLDSGVREPFRVRMTPPDAGRPDVRVRPLVRRTADGRGPSAEDPPPPDRPTPPLSLLPGTVIPAVLITGMNSELPGDVVAQVERDVFDSATLRHVLIPKGTRLVGAYDDQIAYGQNRAIVAWTTMVFPDGRTVGLPGLPGLDLQGAAGLQDRTDRHLDRVFGTAVALAAVGTGLALAVPERDGVDLSPQTVASAQVAIELGRVATELLRRELDVEPTITVRPGYRLLVFLARAMEFDGPYTPAPDPGRFRRFSPAP